jgi:hypothetical protein
MLIDNRGISCRLRLTTIGGAPDMRIPSFGSSAGDNLGHIIALATAAQESLQLKIPTEGIPFHDSVQHLSVRDEEKYQRSLRSLYRHQQESWFPGVLIPSIDKQESQGQLWVYLLFRNDVHMVGRLRNSMVNPVFDLLKHEMEHNQRVVPVIGKVIPGVGSQASTMLAYAKTDLVQFPVY